MLNLLSILQYWDTPDFDIYFKKVIEKLTVKELPLQKALTSSNIALDTSINAVVLNKKDTGQEFIIKAGIFYTGVISGCNCADDPSPVDEQNEYCELMFKIEKVKGDTITTLLVD